MSSDMAVVPRVFSDPAVRPIPVWQSAVFATQVVSNILIAALSAYLLSKFQGREFFFLGILVGQLFLASLWISFGGNRGPVRYALVSLALTTGAGAVALSLDQADGETLCGLIFMGALLVFGLNCVLSPWRWLLGWRLDFALAPDEIETSGRFQWGLKELFLWPLVCTLPLVVCHWIPFQPDDIWDAAAIVLILGLGAGLFAFPLVIALFGQQLSWRARGLLLTSVAAILIGEDLLAARLSGDHLWPLGLATCGIISLNILLARAAGVRWLSYKACPIA